MPEPRDTTHPPNAASRSLRAGLPGYAELHALSNFSFQRGASHPAELVERAHALGYAALAITDECSVAGVVRAHERAGELGLKLILGSEFRLDDEGWRLVALARDEEGWGDLCEFITQARRRAPKGQYVIDGVNGKNGSVAPATVGSSQAKVAPTAKPAEPAEPAELAESAGSDESAEFATDFDLLRGCELILVPGRRALNLDDPVVRKTPGKTNGSAMKGKPAARALATRQTPGQRTDAAANESFGLAASITTKMIAIKCHLASGEAKFCSEKTEQPSPPNLWLAAELLLEADDDLWLAALQRASAITSIPLVAAGDVHMHLRSRKPLQDVISAVRLGRQVSECGFALQANGERHLRSRLRLARIYPPELLGNTLVVASRCTFSLDQLKYRYPLETVPKGLTPAQALRKFTLEGAADRYPHGVPTSVTRQIERELALIADCGYEMYFLTVHDIVRYARSQAILCQGRGSAANSAVCYCLGITAVDPTRSHLLFERFISRERREPPDIDVDFEHQRREEVIQYIYRKYGRERAAIAAVVVSYRPRSAIRDVGKALGLPDALIDRFAKEHYWFDGKVLAAERLALMASQAGEGEEVGHTISVRRLAQWLDLTEQMLGFPRHLSQHVGGFVLTQGKLTRLVPVENAAMPDRSIIQWDKDDLDAMGLLKVDVLALGMLSAIRRCLELVSAKRGKPMELHDIPAEDPKTYDMIRQADTIGVFQIESRAQMSMLPRLLPTTFYDIVVQVAIVRPGPIVGGMVHPYLTARRDPANVRYASEALKPALERTLGVPIFQEQVMQIAMIAAGFSAAEADELRRSMAAWKRKGGVHKFHQRIIDGMTARGYEAEFAERIFKQIEGFGEYGFPESHAYSFALLAYASSWLKCHEPECFLAAMLNSQPMGFYSASQLVQDARRHGVVVRPADVSFSDRDCTLECASGIGAAASASLPGKAGGDARPPTAKPPTRPAVRLGLRQVAHLSEAGTERLVAARAETLFTSTEDLALRAALDVGDLDALAAADALASLSGHRRQQTWDAAALHRAPALLKGAPVDEIPLELPPAREGEEIVFDYASTGLTLRRHPLALLRGRLKKMKLQTAADLRDLPDGKSVSACGIVTLRQQPHTAKGVIFLTIEDETGNVNVIVWKSVREKQRDTLLKSKLLAVHGTWQRDTESGGNVRNLVARRLSDLTPLLGRLAEQGGKSRDFH
ncbi:MAG: error-prone DNA polymerase [Burkholderiales bacterium]